MGINEKMVTFEMDLHCKMYMTFSLVDFSF